MKSSKRHSFEKSCDILEPKIKESLPKVRYQDKKIHEKKCRKSINDTK